MKHRMFSIYDSKGEFYSPPFCQKTVGLAIRAFKDTAADRSTSISAHPEDFTLFALGEFEDRNGTFEIQQATAIMKANEETEQER